jgi:NADH dehydrogenase
MRNRPRATLSPQSSVLSPELDVVTGAFGYTGRHIARRLLSAGKRVKTLTGHPQRTGEFGDAVTVAPFNLDDPDELTRSLQGATTLYNTYWIRFPHGQMTFERAVQNSKTLIKAAEDAGVRRIVHISITNPSPDSPFPYFKGKAIVEKAITSSKLSYAILRPAVIYGDEGILINNIAWFLRRLPVFAVPGSGDYQLRPIFVDDLAELAATLAAAEGNTITDAVGPETYTFNDLLRVIAASVQVRARLVHVHPQLALLVSGLVGYVIGDVVLTRDEVRGLIANLLASDQPPTGQTSLSDWLAQNADWLGRRYVSELRKHYR